MTLYRHKQDDSVLYEVRSAEPRMGYHPPTESFVHIERYEARRVDNPEVFGSQPFLVDAAEWEAIYEPVPTEEGDA